MAQRGLSGDGQRGLWFGYSAIMPVGAPDGYSPPTARDIRSPARFLFWLAWSQWPRILLGMTLGSGWMVMLALPPYVLSRVIDDGLIARDTPALLGWVAALIGVGISNAFLAISRHRTMTKIRMDASFRTVRATVHQCARLGAALTRRTHTGEVVAIGITDVQVLAQSMTVTGPGFGALVAYVVVAVIMFSISPVLALVVLAGVPQLAISVGPLLRRIESAGTDYRQAQGALTNRLVDLLSGLHVLNGLGGKEFHTERYRQRSRKLVAKGYEVGGPASWVTALAAGLPALFLAVVVWLAARMTARGDITIGDLVAVHGYVAVLVIPVSFFIEGGGDIARASVAGKRITRLLRLEPDHQDDPNARPVPAQGPLADPLSGLVIRPDVLTAVVSTEPAEATAVVERLGRFTETDATWSEIRVDTISSGPLREHLLVADNDADFFPGTLREAVAGRLDAEDTRIHSATHTAVMDDVVEALPAGLDAPITSGASTLSGGQRQRLRWARALYADPDVLLAVEPTSAVDATTEAEMAARVRTARQGRTTVIMTTSPVVLSQADEVIFLTGGLAIASGQHHQLLSEIAAYYELVSRGTNPEAPEDVRK